ncbi:TPA: hypothetical protein ACTYSP_004218 [Citrobacter freundii]
MANLTSTNDSFAFRLCIPFNINISEFNSCLLDKEWMNSFYIDTDIINGSYSISERKYYVEKKLGRYLNEKENEELYKRELLQLRIYSDILNSSLEDYFISWLKDSTSQFKKNTLVVIHKNKHKALIFPEVRVMVTNKISFIMPSLHNTQLKPFVSSMGFDFSGVFNVLTTLSFALPPPWGVFAAAGFQLIELIIGSFTNLSNFNSIAQVIRQQLELEFKAHDITTYAADLSNYMTQFQTFVTTANSLPDNISYIEHEVLPFLKGQKTTTTGSIYNSLNQLLIKSYYLGTGPDDKLANYSSLLLVQLITAIMLNQKTIIVFTAQLSSLQHHIDEEKYNEYLDLWLGEYVELRTLINGVMKSSNDIITSASNHRNSLMNMEFKPLPHRGGITQDAICIIQDRWTGYSSTKSVGASQSIDEFKKSMISFYDSYKNEQNKNFFTWVDSVFPKNEINNRLTNSLKTWNEKITPKKPENTILVEFNNKSNNPKWSNKKYIYYAIEFKNFLGSNISEYKKFTTVEGMSPSLSSIPVDNLFLTRARVLHFRDDQIQDEVVTVFKDNVTTVYNDV